jgi:hypothetical protein
VALGHGGQVLLHPLPELGPEGLGLLVVVQLHPGIVARDTDTGVSVGAGRSPRSPTVPTTTVVGG